MENVILVIHLLLAFGLIAIVLLQRSEGGGLGLGGGGGGVMSARGAATALGKVTWALAIAFLATSITLTILAARDAASSSVVDSLGTETPAQTPAIPALPDVSDMLAPPSEDLAPPPVE